jgi:hypothetical protein
MTPVNKKIITRLWAAAGILALSLGITGVFVPVLPTTPFLLLAAFCFFRGSRKLYDWLLHNRLTGDYLRNYLEGRGMALKMKVWTLILLWVTITGSWLFITENLAVRIILTMVLVGVTIHILAIKTIKQK